MNRDIEQIYAVDKIERQQIGAHDIDVRRLDGDQGRMKSVEPSDEEADFVDGMVDALRTQPLFS